MEDQEKIKQRFELLKMARELLNEDYINRRAEDHNKWIAENSEEWRRNRRNIPYPPFAQYPTDEEIVRAASNMYNFIHMSSNQVSNAATQAEHAPDSEQTTYTETTVKVDPTDTFVADINIPAVITVPSEELSPEIEDAGFNNIPESGDPTIPTIGAPVMESFVDKVVAPDEVVAAPVETEIASVPTIEDIKAKGAQVSAAKRLLPGWIRRTV